MGQKECITVKFSEGLAIFDKHYGYLEIDDKEIYNGPTGKVIDVQGIQAHAGRNFFVPEGKEFSFDIDECPYLRIAIKAEQSVTIDTTPPKIIDAMVIPEEVSNDQTIQLRAISEPGCQVIADISELDTTQSKIMLTEERIGSGIYKKESRVSTSNEASNGIKNIKIIATDAVGNVSEPYVITVELKNLQEPESFIVRGIVVTNAGVAARGLKVLAIDKNPGKEIVVGETITDSSGTYTILYEKEALQKRGKQKADIEITIVDPVEESKIYGTYSVHFNADQEEEINLVLQTESVEKRLEYIQITSDLQPKIGEVAFKDFQENKERQDISYLANKTGWDARLVAMVSLADKYGAESGIPAEFYFALFRAGISTDADGLYRASSEKVKKIWEKAVEENIIEASLILTIKQNLAEFKEHAQTNLLEKAKPVGVNLKCGIYAG